MLIVLSQKHSPRAEPCLLYRFFIGLDALFQLRNHGDGYVQQGPGTFRLPRGTQRARRSSISAFCTCTKPRGTSHGTGERETDIEDDQLRGMTALERPSEQFRHLDLYHVPDP
jgi:hypothetical protein